MDQQDRPVGDREPIGDRDIAWAIQLYRNRSQLQWCLSFLRDHYPTSRVVLISDGDSEHYEDIAERYGCEYHAGEHLMTIATCHLFVRRLLTELVRGPEPYYLKIDPDTKVWRRFVRLPRRSSMFGTLERISEGRGVPITGPPNVQGGCIGMTRDVAVAMLESSALTQETFHARAPETWARCEDARRTVALGRFCDDFVLSWFAHHVGFPIVEHPEVLSRWRVPAIDNRDLQFAVTHPHKVRAAEDRQADAVARARGFVADWP